MRDPFEEKKLREKQDADAATEASKADAQFRLDLKKVLSGPEGIRIFYSILAATGVWETTVKTSSEIYVLSGKASVGFEILENVQKIAPESYLEIMKYKFEIESK